MNNFIQFGNFILDREKIKYIVLESDDNSITAHLEDTGGLENFTMKYSNFHEAERNYNNFTVLLNCVSTENLESSLVRYLDRLLRSYLSLNDTLESVEKELRLLKKYVKTNK